MRVRGLLHSSIDRTLTPTREPVPQRALVDPDILRRAASALPVTHEHDRAYQVPLRQLRHIRVPSTRNVSGRPASRCGNVDVP